MSLNTREWHAGYADRTDAQPLSSRYRRGMPYPRPEQAFDRLAARYGLVRQGGALAAALTGIIAGTMAVATHRYGFGFVLLAAGFAADGLGQAIARRDGVAARPVLPAGLLLVPFGFALATPERALAAMMLLAGLALFATVRAMAGRMETDLLHAVVALGLLGACLFPAAFSLVAYCLGVACFAAAGQAAVRGRS